ncbi:uncharacterized protein BDZ99DRAFT_79853 [Mytilinidion resinicola]|uniref:Transcription factor domain-containing protein n=1 Tax=Mytilinidion resinicola TaxID=574789 RepID=A0A6A6YHD5_9PEZI|nr:uncharacterized protein BDZ99DRAFT_79853 [Mytilinidion resinicola]KAF2807425.1 hypothetical protein BDZ99DRAFT_79853 [Mytilinidion resinicola]
MSAMALQSVPVSFTFVNQTASSVVAKPDEEDLAIIKSHAMRAVHRQRRASPRKPVRPPKLAAPLATDWEDFALCKFFDDFVFPKENASGNAFRYLDFLPSIYKRDARQSHLTDAVLAVALVHFANQRRVDGLNLRARRKYARSLNLVNRSLANPVEKGSDEVLATLCLLAKYEIISGDETGLWRSHERGQAALINHRGKAQLQTEAGLGLFRLVWIRQQLNCIAQSAAPPERPTFNWDAAFPSPHLKHLMLLVSRLVLGRSQARELFADGYAAVAEEKTMEQLQWSHEVHSINEDMLSFRQSLPLELHHWSISSCEVIHEAGRVREAAEYFPVHLNLFHNLHHASIWHIYTYCQIYLLQSLIQHTFPLNDCHHDAQQQVQEASLTFTTTVLPDMCLHLRLQQAIDDVCASVPFLLGWSDDARFLNTAGRGRGIACHYIIWVLAAALSIREVPVPKAQWEWIRARLIEVGFLHGIRHALVFA